MNNRLIKKMKRSPVASGTLVGLTLLCGFLLASDSTAPTEEDEWVIPTFATHGSDFALWNECEKIRLSVAVEIVDGDDADELGFKEEKVQTLFESRLRAAKLFSTGISYPSPDALLVYVSAGVHNAWIWRIDYTRSLDIGFGEFRYATIWEDGGYGVHGYDEGYIMQSLSEKVDRFILKYLTINEQACETVD